jgi:hypothetical protein
MIQYLERIRNISTRNQEYFNQKTWTIVNPEQDLVRKRLASLPKLSNFMNIVQGFVTGQDKVFIRRRELIPRGEEKAYIDYLPDRKIGSIQSSKAVGRGCFLSISGRNTNR